MNSEQDHNNSETFSVVELLMLPFNAVKEVFEEYSGDNKKRRSRLDDEKSMAERVLGFLTLPFRMVFGFVVFLISNWSTSRNGFAFLKGLPVLGAIGCFGGALLFAEWRNPEGNRLAHNAGHLGYHTKESPEFCEMFARNLIKLKAEPENIYRLGLAYDGDDEPTKAYDVMQYLAPDNMLGLLGKESSGNLEITPGYSNAHIWLSRYYARTRTLDITDQLRDALVEQHLNVAVKLEPENMLALYNLAFLHLAELKKLDKGSPEYVELAELTIKELERVVDPSEGITGFHLSAMPRLIELQIEVEEDQLELQKRLALQINRLQPLADQFPNEVEILWTMVRCAILMEDFPRAKSIVESGFRSATDGVAKQKIINIASHVYLQNAAQYTDLTDPIHFRQRVHKLAEAVISNPRDRIIYVKLLDFIGTIPTEPGVINQEWLSDSINGAANPGIIHCLLGLKKITDGNVLEGEKHWRIAGRQYGNSRLVINNLLDVASAERPSEFKNLFETMGLAIEMFPDLPVLHRTRGVFLASQGRYEEAIEDLAYASKEMPRVADIHQHLILCYEKTGEEDKAFEQKQMLENKLGTLEEKQRKQLEKVINEISH